MRYRVKIMSRAQKSLARIPKRVAREMLNQIDELADDPRPRSAKKLQGRASWYRLRVGKYRVIYEIQDRQLIIFVLDVGHRGQIYNLLKHM